MTRLGGSGLFIRAMGSVWAAAGGLLKGHFYPYKCLSAQTRGDRLQVREQSGFHGPFTALDYSARPGQAAAFPFCRKFICFKRKVFILNWDEP